MISNDINFLISINLPEIHLYFLCSYSQIDASTTMMSGLPTLGSDSKGYLLDFTCHWNDSWISVSRNLLSFQYKPFLSECTEPYKWHIYSKSYHQKYIFHLLENPSNSYTFDLSHYVRESHCWSYSWDHYTEYLWY